MFWQQRCQFKRQNLCLLMSSRHKQLYEKQNQGTPISPPFAWAVRGIFPTTSLPNSSAEPPDTRDNQCNCCWLQLIYWWLDWLLTCQSRVHRHMHVSRSTQFTPPFGGDHQNHMDLTKASKRIPKYNFWLQLQIRKKFSFVAIIHTDTVQQILWKNVFGKQECILGTDKEPHKPELVFTGFCLNLPGRWGAD